MTVLPDGKIASYPLRDCRLRNDEGLIDVHNPVPNTMESVFPNDIKNDLSDVGTFTGADLLTLFNNLDDSITDTSATNPKWFKFFLERPIKFSSVGIVAKTGNFSNIKITLLDRQDTILQVIDDSANDTDYTSRRYNTPSSGNACCILVEFYTADPVTVSFLYIRKQLGVNAVIIGVRDDGTTGQMVMDNENRPMVNSQPYLYAIAEGAIAGHSPLLKFGTRTTIAAGTQSTIWEGPTALYSYMTTAQQLKVVSTDNVNDNVGGTGALTLTLLGLDENWEEISETVTMTGTTAVTTTASFIRVFRAYVATCGTSLTNTGTISILNNASTVTQAIINIGDGQTLMALWTVPAGKVAYLTHGTFSTDSNKGARISLFTRLNDGGTLYPWLIKYRAFTFSGNENFPFNIPFPFPAKTDVEVRVTTPVAAGATGGGATFELWYEDV